MKKIFILIILGFTLTLHAQDKIKFTYDAVTGNQLTRSLCLNCANKPGIAPKEIESISEEDLLKFSPQDVISYYPNPVREELYLQWEFINDNFVTAIQITAVNGQIVHTYDIGKKANTQNIPFQGYPSGVYIVSLNYSNGDPKTIKIIKQ
jgi:hypothetical protein